MTRESAISEVTRLFDEGLFIETLARRVAIRSESQIPESRPFLDAYLNSEILPAFNKMGFTPRFSTTRSKRSAQCCWLSASNRLNYPPF